MAGAQADPLPPRSRMALLIHPGRWGLPSACPDCLRACAYLCLAAVPHQIVPCPAQLTGDLPLLEDYTSVDSRSARAQSATTSTGAAGPSASGQAPPSSSEPPPSAHAPAAEPSARPGATAWGAQQGPVVVLASAYTEGGGGIGGYLRVHRGIDLDAALSSQERVELLGLRALIDSYLSAALEVEQWLDSSNHRAVNGDLYAACLPWPVSSITLWQQQRLRRLRWSGRMDARAPEDEGPSDQLPAQVIARAKDAYKALAQRLGRDTLFFAERLSLPCLPSVLTAGRPSSLDAALYAHLAFVLRAPLVRSALRECVRELPALVHFVEAMEGRMKQAEAAAEGGKWAEDAYAPPPFTRVPPLKQARPGPEKAEELKSKKAERDAKRGGRLFLLGQLGAIVCYFLVNIVSLEVDQGEDDDGIEDDDDEMDE